MSDYLKSAGIGNRAATKRAKTLHENDICTIPILRVTLMKKPDNLTECGFGDVEISLLKDSFGVGDDVAQKVGGRGQKPSTPITSSRRDDSTSFQVPI